MDNGKLSIIPNLIIVCYTFNISSNEMVKKVSKSSAEAIKSVEFNVNDKLKFYETLSKLNFGTQYGLRIETEEGKLYLAIQTENLA
jgi:hypothetical protein